MMRGLKHFIIVLAVAIGAGSFSFGAGKDVGVCVLFFNDVHGHLAPFTVEKDGRKAEWGGVARLARHVENIRAENRARGIRTVVLLAGDTLQGTPLSTVFTGKADIDCYNLMKLDAMTVGNHEFDFGLENFMELKARAEFPVISANVFSRPGGQALCPASASFDLGEGFALTVIGVTTPELLTTTAPLVAEKLAVKDPVGSVAPFAAKAKSAGPVVILSHSGWKVDMELASKVPGVMAVIGGHDQILLDPPKESGGVMVFQAFEWCKYLGRVDIAVDPSTRKGRVVAWRYIPVRLSDPADPAVEKTVADYNSRLGAAFREVLAENMTFLDAERGRIRYEETNLGDYAADVMRAAAKSDMAFINAGSIRASVQKGAVTMEHVYTMMPYANDIVTVSLTGSEVLDVLRRSVKGDRDDEDGGFLHLSGIAVRVKGSDVISVTSGGKPLSPSARYRVAVTEFMASGGDGYSMLKGKAAVRTGAALREAVIADLRARKKVDVRADGRFTRE